MTPLADGMIHVDIVFHAWRRLATQPLAWLVGAALLSVHPLLSMAAPLGIQATQPTDFALIQEVAFMGALVGAAAGAGCVHSLAAAIEHGGGGPGWGWDLLAVGSVAVLGAAIGITPAILVEPSAASGFTGSAGIRLGLGVAGLAALGGVLLRLRLPSGSVPWALVAAVLSAPLVLPDPIPARSIAALAAALLCAAWLLDHPPGRTA